MVLGPGADTHAMLAGTESAHSNATLGGCPEHPLTITLFYLQEAPGPASSHLWCAVATTARCPGAGLPRAQFVKL